MSEFVSFLHVVDWIIGGGLLIYGLVMLWLGNSIVQNKKERGLAKISFFETLRLWGYVFLPRKKWHTKARDFYAALRYLRHGEFSILFSAAIIILSALF